MLDDLKVAGGEIQLPDEWGDACARYTIEGGLGSDAIIEPHIEVGLTRDGWKVEAGTLHQWSGVSQYPPEFQTPEAACRTLTRALESGDEGGVARCLAPEQDAASLLTRYQFSKFTITDACAMGDHVVGYDVEGREPTDMACFTRTGDGWRFNGFEEKDDADRLLEMNRAMQRDDALELFDGGLTINGLMIPVRE